MGRITRWNAYGYEVTGTPNAWHETDVEVYEPLLTPEVVCVRRAGKSDWVARLGTVPEAVRWWFSGKNTER